jgi:hypothetical protein
MGMSFGMPLDDLLHFLRRHDRAGRVVRVAEVEEADVARVAVRGGDHAGDVLAVILEQRHLDRIRLDAGGVREDRAVGRVGAEDELAALQVGGADDVEHFTRAGGEQDVLALHAVVFGDRLDDVAVGVAVAVGVLEGVLHRLHHRRGRTPVVFVAGDLHVGVVDRFTAGELLGAHLPEEAGGLDAQRADGRGYTTEKPTTRKRMPDVHAKPSKRNLVEPEKCTRSSVRMRARRRLPGPFRELFP